MKKLEGYLFAKLSNIGSRSEGPTYYLQQCNYNELQIIKQVNLWEEDPALQPFLNSKVAIDGEVHPDGIVYEQVTSHDRACI